MQAAAVLAGVRAARTDPVRVREFTAADAPAWEAFVARCPEATFFHRIGWRTLLEQEFRHRTHYLLAERSGALCGVLPVALNRSFIKLSPLRTSSGAMGKLRNTNL